MIRTMRPFQKRLFKLQMNGKNVLLQAPTGAGKTYAALAPYLQNLSAGNTVLPNTCRYAVPMRVLAHQFYQEYRDQKFGSMPKLSHFVQAYQAIDKPPVAIQTGEQPDDPLFESALTFCTIDQLLSSFLGIPYGLGTRQANMNVGAVLGSYLVLDEFHLYPLGRLKESIDGARTTALQMLRMLNQKQQRLSPFTLMSATFSTGLLERLAELLSAEIVSIETEAKQANQPSELEQLMQGRQRRFYTQSQPMQAEQILDVHDGCSLVICNTVARAQQMYLQLRDAIEQRDSPTQVMLLHSRFISEDRQAKQAELEAEMGSSRWQANHYTGKDLIVVATQVVEVGVDISARTLHSEIAPANSIIQRAGRCARFAGQQGTVYLYPLGEGQSYQPYRKEQCQTTFDAFAQFNGQLIDFVREQQIIDEVHSAEDLAMLEQFATKQVQINQTIFDTLANPDRGKASTLIRDVRQVSIAIHSDPNTALTKRPWEAQLFSLFPYSLVGRWDDIKAYETEQPVIWEAQLNEQSNAENERMEPTYTWIPVATSNRIPYALFLALSPQVANYTYELGLQIRDSRHNYPWPNSTFESQMRPSRKRTFSTDGYDQESYLEHIQALLNAFHQSGLKESTKYIAQQLETALGLLDGSIHTAMRLAIACHDIGKLSVGWQRWARAWQELLFNETGDQHYQIRKAPFAHTDTTSALQRQYGSKLKVARPNHACESALYALPLVYELNNNITLTRAITAAIARHHSATSTNYTAQSLIPQAVEHINAALQACSLQPIASSTIDPIPQNGELSTDEMIMPRSEYPLEAWLYFVLVRTLRLADQRSFAFRD